MNVVHAKELVLLSAAGSRSVLRSGSTSTLAVNAVLPPGCPPGTPLFDHGFSQWMLCLTLDNSEAGRHTTFRSPHDVWRFLRGRVGVARNLHVQRRVTPEPQLVLADLLYCNDGSREPYPLLLCGQDEALRHVTAFDKYTGLHLSLHASSSRLFWECTSGGVSAEPSSAGDLSGYLFECSVEELLALPAYEPVTDRWRKLILS